MLLADPEIKKAIDAVGVCCAPRTKPVMMIDRLGRRFMICLACGASSGWASTAEKAVRKWKKKYL